LQTVLSAFRVLPTIPQTFSHFWIPHFTFHIPDSSIPHFTNNRVLRFLGIPLISGIRVLYHPTVRVYDKVRVEVLQQVR